MAGETGGTDETRVRDEEAVREREPVRDRAGGAITGDRMASVRAAQRERFGGISWGADFFGFLTAAGLTGLLAGIVSGAGAATGLTKGSAETIGIGSAIALLIVLAIAYFCGGYVAGRMSRFDGARQGVGVWLWGIIVAIVVAILAAVFGSEYNVLDQLNLPRIPIDQGTLTTGGIIALAAFLIATLGAAIVGGKVGQRFHRKVDDVAVGV
jgi:VIT1/CCC1 family predicted Fe2+/Mn2+ transporter